MRADYLTFREALRASSRGLIVQIVLALTMLVYGRLSGDFTAVTASIFMGIGALGWLALTIVYDQHRRERMEALEADALASSPLADTSVFKSGEEFRPAARRLAALYKAFLPGMSLLIAALLIGVGIWRIYQIYFADPNKPLVSPEGFSAPIHNIAGLIVGIVVGATGFLVARYAAGMAKQEMWANLRAGASFAVGTAMLGFLLAIGIFIDIIGPDTFLRYLQPLAAGFMVLIGAEVVINFLLGVYRPRRANEIPKPAFDSKLLGFVAAPDRIAESISEAINYQLGFNVSSGWAYQLLSRTVMPLILFGAVVVWLMSTVTIVEPHQRAMILRFGKVVHQDLAPGLHFKAPWPVDSVVIPEYVETDTRGRKVVMGLTASGLRTIELGTMPPALKDPILWTNDHAGAEVFQFVRASSDRSSTAGSTPGASEAGLTTDIAMVSVEIPLQYVVSDVLKYDQLTVPEKRDDMLKAVAQRELTRFFQGVTLPEVLGADRTRLSRQLQDRLQTVFDNMNPGPDGKPMGAGVKITFVAIRGVHPPRETASAFETPVQADQNREANLSAAQADAIEAYATVVGDVALSQRIIAELDKLDLMKTMNADAKAMTDQELLVQGLIESASGSASSQLAKARSDRWAMHMGTRGVAARYKGQLALYEANPALFKARNYFAAFSEAMEGSRVYITSENVQDLRVDVDLKDRDLGTDIFSTNTAGFKANN